MRKARKLDVACPNKNCRTFNQIGLKNIGQRYEIITKRKIEIKKTENAFMVLIPLIQTVL